MTHTDSNLSKRQHRTRVRYCKIYYALYFIAEKVVLRYSILHFSFEFVTLRGIEAQA